MLRRIHVGRTPTSRHSAFDYVIQTCWVQALKPVVLIQTAQNKCRDYSDYSSNNEPEKRIGQIFWFGDGRCRVLIHINIEASAHTLFRTFGETLKCADACGAGSCPGSRLQGRSCTQRSDRTLTESVSPLILFVIHIYLQKTMGLFCHMCTPNISSYKYRSYRILGQSRCAQYEIIQSFIIHVFDWCAGLRHEN